MCVPVAFGPRLAVGKSDGRFISVVAVEGREGREVGEMGEVGKVGEVRAGC
jgi:hypothetical protein